MNLRHIFFLILLMIIPCGVHAQAVNFSYDAAGNRIKREIVIGRQDAPMIDSSQDYYTENMPSGSRIKIRPVTQDGMIRINLISPKGNNGGSVETFDMSGTKVQGCTFDGSSAMIDLGKCPKGVYIIHIETEDESTDWKIIKK